MKVTVTIHPSFDPWYYSFYLKGIFQNFSEIKFSRLISEEDEKNLFETGFGKDFFLFSIKENEKSEKLIVIGADDKPNINPFLYSVADVYGKVNLNTETLKNFPKVVSIGPSFGIKYPDVFFLLKLLYNQIIDKSFDLNKWRMVNKRVSYEFYTSLQNENTNNRYVFYLNYPWKKHTEVTDKRKLIIERLQYLDSIKRINFVGGFSKRRFGYFKDLEMHSAHNIYTHKSYLRNIAKSNLVINTPAVHNCLGWKLGEYLMLGKAIISSPIQNIMPDNFENGKHYHEVPNIEIIDNDIMYLVDNKKYVNYLESNALKYFEDYLSPLKVINRLINL